MYWLAKTYCELIWIGTVATVKSEAVTFTIPSTAPSGT